MRLLQLATGPTELIDLHPHITVLTGLTDEQRTLLAAAVRGMATGSGTGVAGLVEAHGVMFDLTPELLSLIEPSGDEITPVVRAGDLPTSRVPTTALNDLTTAEHALAMLVQRSVAADQAYLRALAGATAAREGLDRAQRLLADHDAGAQDRIAGIDQASAQIAEGIERVRQAEEVVADLRPQLEEASANRMQAEADTVDVRTRHQDALARCQRVAIELEQTRAALDPGAGSMLAAAEDELVAVIAAVEAERVALADGTQEQAVDGPSLVELEARQAELAGRLESLARRGAAFAPISRDSVAAQLERVQSIDGAELVESPEALALADRIDATDAELAALPASSAGSRSIASVKARLEDARLVHREAEQAVRNPELDRAVVDQLETIHASLLDVMDKVDGRFGSARAQKRLEDLRDQEHAVLDQLGFQSYSDYMMGYSLLHVDPEKEDALDASRVELAAAEDEWRQVEGLTDAERTRAEVQQRRDVLVDEARRLLGRAADAATITGALREHRIEGTTKVAATRDLQLVLVDGGLELGSADLSFEEVVLVAEAYLDEVDLAASRQREFEAEHQHVEEQLAALGAAIHEVRDREARNDLDPEVAWTARIDGAERAVTAGRARARAHEEARAAAAALEEELGAATAEEARTGSEAAEAEEAVTAALDLECPLAEAVEVAETELVEARQLEAAGREAQRVLEESGPEASLDDLTKAVTSAEVAHTAAVAEGKDALADRGAVEEQRLAAEATVAAARTAAAAASDGASVAEEVEWYLLARLAAQRSVSLGGSTPLLLDEALGHLTDADVQHVLDRLERMAEAVQVIVVSEDPKVSGWALLAGPDRAAVVRPEKVPAS